MGARGPSQFSHAYKKLHGKLEDTILCCLISARDDKESGELRLFERRLWFCSSVLLIELYFAV